MYLMAGLVDHQVGGAAAVQLDAMFVVPLDIAVDFLAIAQHDDHRRLGLHLLLIIEIFGVGLLAGRGPLGRGSAGTVSISVAISVPVPVSAFGGYVVWGRDYYCACSARLRVGRISLRFAKLS